MSALEAARDRFVAAHARVRRERARGEPAWLARTAREALAAFAAPGCRRTRHEDWRYTNLAPLARMPFALAAPGARSTRADARGARDAALRVQPASCSSNGRFAPELSSRRALPGGVRCDSLAALLARRREPVEARLDRSSTEAAPVRRAQHRALRGRRVSSRRRAASRSTQPIHLVFATSAARRRARPIPRVVVVAERRAAARMVVQDHVSARRRPALHERGRPRSPSGAGATVHWCCSQRERDARFHVSQPAGAPGARRALRAAHAHARRRAACATTSACVLAGRAPSATLDGLFLGGGSQLVDNHTTVDHAAPHCTSRELYKGVLDGALARRLPRPRDRAARRAEDRRARSRTRTCCSATRAEIDTKPQLEIYADDVKCSHGATIGRLDEDALFYLRSRGLGEPRARDLLLRAFAREVLERLPGARARARRSTTRVARAACARAARRRRRRELDVERVRTEFPILARRVHGKPLVYLDSAASAQKPRAVLDAITRLLRDALRERPPRRPRALREATRRATRRRARRSRASSARRRARDRVRARHDRGDQPGRAELRPPPRRPGRRGARHRARAPREHRAVADPLRGERRARCAWRRSTTAAMLLLDEFERCSRRARSSSRVAHVSNALGTVIPVAEIARARARARGVPCSSTARRPCRTCRSTCGRSAATSTPSRATSSTARPASACSGAAPSCSRRCRRGRAAAT